MSIGRILAASVAGSVLFVANSNAESQGAFEGIDTYLGTTADASAWETLTQQADALSTEIAALQAQGTGTAKQKAKLAELKRIVAQLKENIAAAAADNNPDELAFLTAELTSLRKQVPAIQGCESSLAAAGWTSPTGLKYQVTAVDPQIVRVRVGSSALPEDASWAVLANARKALACSTSSSTRTLTTNALKVTAAPAFNPDGSFTFKGAIPTGSNFYGLGDKPDSIDKFGKSFVNQKT